MSAHTGRARRGFSLIELIITLVLVSIIGVAAGRLLMSQTRFYTRLSGQRDARSVTRGARNIIQTELSMVEAGGGVTAASNSSLTVRVPYAWGVYCSASTMMRLPVDAAMYSMATLAGYAIRDTMNTTTGAYTYTATTTAPTTGGTTATDCMTTAGITAPTDGAYLSLSPAVSFPTPAANYGPGSPMFLYQTITYSFAASALVPGKLGLFRSVGGGTPEELLAPFDATAQFYYYSLNTATASVTVPALTDIRGVELHLNAQSPNRASNRAEPESASITTSIFFRNRMRTDS